MKRVVITGLGIVSPLGDKDNLWDSLLKGISGIDQINRFDASALSVRIGAEVRDFDPTLFMERKDARRMDRFAQFAVAAAKMGLADAKLEIPLQNPNRVGVLVGSGIGGIETVQEQSRVFWEKGPERVTPFLFL